MSKLLGRDTSPKKFMAGKKLRILSPNGGQKLIIGRLIPIYWWVDTTSKDFTVRLVLLDGNRAVGTIARNVPAKKGRYNNWKTGELLEGRLAPPGNNYRIAIHAEGTHGRYIKDVSDRVFSIEREKKQPVIGDGSSSENYSPPIQLLTSFSGETLSIGTTHQIRWIVPPLSIPCSSPTRASITAWKQDGTGTFHPFAIKTLYFYCNRDPVEHSFTWDITYDQFADNLGTYTIRIVTETGHTGESGVFSIAAFREDDLEMLSLLSPSSFRIERIGWTGSTGYGKDTYRMYVTLRVRHNTGRISEIDSLLCYWRLYRGPSGGDSDSFGHSSVNAKSL